MIRESATWQVAWASLHWYFIVLRIPGFGEYGAEEYNAYRRQKKKRPDNR
jgi:hypothetical protein